MQVIDKPAESRCVLHPAQKSHDLRVWQVVGKKRAQYQIGWTMQLRAEGVPGQPADLAIGGRELMCRTCRVGIEINAGKLHGYRLTPGPSLDPLQHIAAATTHIHHVKRTRAPAKLPQPLQRRTGIEGEPVGETQGYQARPELFVRARFIHPLGDLGAVTEAQRTKRHGI